MVVIMLPLIPSQYPQWVMRGIWLLDAQLSNIYRRRCYLYMRGHIYALSRSTVHAHIHVAQRPERPEALTAAASLMQLLSECVGLSDALLT